MPRTRRPRFTRRSAPTPNSGSDSATASSAHFFNGGALSPQKILDRWHALTTQIDRAVVAESARWGDYQRPSQPYTRANAWLPHLQWMDQNYWPQIPATALQRIRSANLFPALNAPRFNRFGGEFTPGFQLEITNPNANSSVLFTLDGSDPRLSGGATAASAQTYTGPVPLSGSAVVSARVKQGSSWSALVTAAFRPDPDLDDDGLPDEWESAHGLDPDNATDATMDFDDDGHSNAAEFAAGTDPRDSSSTFVLALASHSGGTIELTFTAQPDRRYRIERSTDLSLASWTVRQAYDPEFTVRQIVFAESPSPSARRLFYRIVAEAPAP